TGSSSRCNLPVTARVIGARASQHRLPGQIADLPSSLRCRAPFRSETALPEANSFLCECQQFCNIPGELLDNDLGERVADVA
ncbi:MAG TPA: hypothetical protein VE197_01090, partial [Mycobacterium sp.]|nr:hypothetical protein [Mycobacterium sp.]